MSNKQPVALWRSVNSIIHAFNVWQTLVAKVSLIFLHWILFS